jgi:general secretion pathway protein J
MIRTAQHNDAGYSLVELLVVLLLLSFITLSIAGGFRFGTRIWETTDASVARSHRIAIMQSVVRSLMASAVPEAKGAYIEFEGTPNDVRFVAPAPRYGAAGGIAKVEVSLEDIRSDRRMLIRIAPRVRSAGAQTARLDLDGLNLRFAYLDASDARAIWLDRWHDRDRLPSAIRLEGTDGESRAEWPLFVARLPVDQPVHCIFDPVSLSCRNA